MNSFSNLNMGKISPQSIKYLINIKFTAEGVVGKPDVIGAIFGQTEGLLGEELELRELQKMGKIGRINAVLEVNEGKTTGIIEVPTSIDKAETTIIAAAVETIDRIGPCSASFEINSIEDVRSSKREYIVERAKKLLEKFSAETPKLREMEQDIINHTKTARVSDYGRELLAAGPNLDLANEVIVVEGRADVINLLRSNIKNGIAMNGTVIPKTVKELSQKKETTLFIDGDRGGFLIAMNAVDNANIDFVARAPDGKEVEELSEKEVLMCLRNKITAQEFREKFLEKRPARKRERKRVKRKEKTELDEKIKSTFQHYLQEIEGTKNVLILSFPYRGNIRIIRKVKISEIVRAVYAKKKVYALVIDGIVTPQIIRAAEKVNCQYIIARNFSATSDKIKLLSF